MDEGYLKRHAALIGEIRATLAEYKGKPLHVHANLGRSKIFEREGILLSTYDSLFIFESEEKRGRKSRQSYQYVDILTGMVELSNPETGIRLFDFIEEEDGVSGIAPGGTLGNSASHLDERLDDEEIEDDIEDEDIDEVDIDDMDDIEDFDDEEAADVAAANATI